MGYFLTAAIVSFLIVMYLVAAPSRNTTSNGQTNASQWGLDSQLAGPQKFHTQPVPRVGGIAIFGAIAICSLAAWWFDRPQMHGLALLTFCGIPALAFGLAEDLTGSITPRARLIATGVSAALAIFVADSFIDRVDVPGIDNLLVFSVFSVPLTIFAVAGVANSINIIDGFNGLSSMVAMMIFAAIAYVAHQTNDQFITIASLACIGALLGFFVWNYPLGLIFLGDGGAYFVGFMVAELSILLFHRNDDVSPWFSVLVLAYPITETAFTIYRRRFLRGISTVQPDRGHLHQLVFSRVLYTKKLNKTNNLRARNSKTAPYLWALSCFSIVPAVICWNKPFLLFCFVCLFVCFYVWLYARIVQFKTPFWLIYNKK